MCVQQRKRSTYVYEGRYVAEVEVALMGDETGSPYLCIEDAYKLDDVREALRQGDLESAASEFVRVRRDTVIRSGLVDFNQTGLYSGLN